MTANLGLEDAIPLGLSKQFHLGNTYSLEDLEYIAENLADNHERFFNYLKDNGLMRP